MAAPMEFLETILLLEQLNEESDVLISQFIVNTNALRLCLLMLDMKRPSVPRIHSYVENVLPMFETEDYRSHFRVSKQMFEQILENVEEELYVQHRGGSEQIAPHKQLLIFLCYMANTETMREIGQYFGVGKSTVHYTIRRVLEAFNRIFKPVIKWPSVQRQHEIARELQLRHGLPGIIGALDGTHIKLSSCPGGDRDYINRTYFPSMQLQIVIDDSLLITDAYTGLQGCTHDPRVLRNPSLYEMAVDGHHIDQIQY